MKRQTQHEIGVFIFLVLLGVGLRLYFHFVQAIPNFAPVAALALFAGYYFRSWAPAIAAPVCIMTISDYYIGGYSWQMMAVVYGMLALPVMLRGPLRRHLRMKKSSLSSAISAVLGLVACGLGSSLVFFMATNFGAWLWFDMYERTFSGLVLCYWQALPFFRYTVAGDLFFAFSLFSGYALAMNWGWAIDPQEAESQQELAFSAERA